MTKHDAFNLKEIGARLRTLRAYQRKTQSSMAKDLGISLSHYSKLEIGIGGMSHGLALALMEMVTQADFMGLAERVSNTMDISLPRAMAMLAREKIRAKRQACLPQLPGLPTLSEEELPQPENSGEEK